MISSKKHRVEPAKFQNLFAVIVIGQLPVHFKLCGVLVLCRVQDRVLMATGTEQEKIELLTFFCLIN